MSKTEHPFAKSNISTALRALFCKIVAILCPEFGAQIAAKDAGL
jgi:hypothetical protein